MHVHAQAVSRLSTTRTARRCALRSLAAISLAACTSPLSPSELRALIEAEARWAARGFQDYAFETRTICGECAGIVMNWARVEVAGGSVNRVVLLASGTEVSPEERGYFATVEDRFRT